MPRKPIVTISFDVYNPWGRDSVSNLRTLKLTYDAHKDLYRFRRSPVDVGTYNKDLNPLLELLNAEIQKELKR